MLVDCASDAAKLGMVLIAARPASSCIDWTPSGVGSLSPREREVAELVTQGLTNREIAARLYLSERRAQNHVQHILTKLDLANRSQIAVWVTAKTMMSTRWSLRPDRSRGTTPSPLRGSFYVAKSVEGYSNVQPQELTSRTMVPRPVSMWVVQGMQGSKLRMARRTSMPLTWSSGTLSSSGVSTMASS